MIPKHRKPAHPGEILLREFLEPMELSQVELAHRDARDLYEAKEHLAHAAHS